MLPLAEKPGLSAEQTRKTAEPKDAVTMQARRIGELIVTSERELDALFSTGRADKKSVAAIINAIGRLQGQLRFVHLKAHLDESKLLSSEQIALYAQLSGHQHQAAARGAAA